MHSARLDNWRDITALAETWQAGSIERAELDTAITAMEAVEGYYAYPGPTLFAALRERIAANDAASAARLARRGSNALLTRLYRARPSVMGPAQREGSRRGDRRSPSRLGGRRDPPALLRGPLRL